MAKVVSAFDSGLAFRLALATCLAGMLAGCADSERLSDPFSNPFRGDVDRTPTAAINSAPTAPVQSRPLAPPSQSYSYSSRPAAAYTAPAYPSQHFASHTWNGTDTINGVSHGQNIAGWTAEGGMPIVMAQGETAEIIARRYGIPTEALLRTNGFTSSWQIRPGARIIIPTYNAALAASSGVHPGARRERLHFVRGPEPADPRSARSERTESKQLAKMKNEKAERREALKNAKKHEASARIGTDVIAERERPVSAPESHKPTIDRMPTSSLVDEESKGAATASNAPEFRWPAHGRIILGYKSSGNEGINIALPEGTSVKAAESGVVAYAGNDLKGYGNLVLIRHPNGFVTAYANNDEIDVKRGDVVKRGQVIAKSGQTGNVASPQLHFEVRKGSTPVDPTQYLAGL